MTESAEMYAWARKLVEASKRSPSPWGLEVAEMYQKLAAQTWYAENGKWVGK